MSWTDFNNAEDQANFDVIPKGTLVKVRMTIDPGAFNQPDQGWDGGLATRNEETGSVYLSCEFIVMEGEYARRKVWSLIGLHSEKGPGWGNMGRGFIKSILNSSRGIHPKDDSPAAQNGRKIQGVSDLDGIEFLAKIGMDKDQNGDPKNIINIAIMPDNDQYSSYMSGVVPAQNNAQTSSGHATYTPPAQQPAAQSLQKNQSPAPTGRPNWAQ